MAKIKGFFKEHWAITTIIVFALLLRLWYFYITYGQAAWFDSSEALSWGKLWANQLNGNPYEINPQRPPFFFWLIAGVFASGLPGPGIGEEIIILLFVLLPSVILVLTVYLLGKEMFNASGHGKTVGLIAAAFAAVGWSWVFWSNRVEPDFLSMTFQVLAVLFMWKYWKSSNQEVKCIKDGKEVTGLELKEKGCDSVVVPQRRLAWAILAGFFTAWGFCFKVSGLLVPMIFIAFIIIKDGLKAFKDKGYWLYAGTFVMFMVPYFIWAYRTFGDIFAFKLGYIDAPTDFPSFGWYNLNFYQTMTTGILWIVFLAAVLLAVLRIFSQNKDKLWAERCSLDGKLFCLIVFVVVSCFYIFYMRNTDDRWIFLWMPFIYTLSAWFLVEVGRYFIKGEGDSKNSKKIVMVIIWIIVAVIAVQQLQHADMLIKYKADSYGPVRDAALWIKANSPPSAKVLSISYPQMVYYSERNVTTYSTIKSAEEFQQLLIENKWEFLTVSIFEPHPPWVYSWVTEQQQKGNIVPVWAAWQDPQTRTQPSLIVYFINTIEQNKGVSVNESVSVNEDVSNQSLSVISANA